MRELCILFMYHQCDDLTLRHFHLVKEQNPSSVVVPVCNSLSEQLPDSVDVKNFQSKWDTRDKWRSCDTLLYLWFANRPLNAKRYIVVEYDVLCTQPFAEAYRDVWDAEVACANLTTQLLTPNWVFFSRRQIAALPAKQRPYAAGIVPLACAQYSHRALEVILEHVTENDVFCELRLGTAVRYAGLEVTRFPRRLRRTITYHPYTGDRSSSGIYHAVKPQDQESSWRRLEDDSPRRRHHGLNISALNVGMQLGVGALRRYAEFAANRLVS